MIQAFSQHNKDVKWAKRLRYFLSGITYLLLAYSAVQVLLYSQQSNGDQNQHWAGEILSKPLGQWLLGIGALLIAAIGIYQIHYGVSEKYKKHVQGSGHHSHIEKQLLLSGKVGYIARGLVWLIIAYLLINAALHASASEAGDTGKALQLVEGSFGSILLGALSVGLMLYGVFNFIRARYGKFE